VRIAYHSLEMLSLCWQRRLFDEGVELLVYVKENIQRRVGKGIVPICENFDVWMMWGLQDPNTLFFFDFTEAGDVADRLRKAGKLVLCGGSFLDKLEKKREWGQAIAEQAGILCPPTYQFSSVSESLSFLSSDPEQTSGDGGWAWKPSKDLSKDCTLVTSDAKSMISGVQHIQRRFGDSVPCIIQERIPGVAVSTSRWFNGKSWVGPYTGTIEEKKFMDKDIGPATGCSLNTLWFYKDEEPEIARALKFKELEGIFRSKNAPPGLYDINAILNNEGAWFLEWTPRLGYDSEMTSQRGFSSLSTLLWSVATGQSIDHLYNKDTMYHGVNISVPPYPSFIAKLDNDSPALGIPVSGADGMWENHFVATGVAFDPVEGITVENPLGYVGVVVTDNNSVEDGFDDILDYIKEELKVQNLQYRTDCADNINKDLKELKKMGWKTK
jgi:phosphoribosylamine-glycine ligase